LKVLVSNDDGISAPGLRCLAERLAEESDLEVYVVAPDRERSCTGHSLTMHEPIWVDKTPNFKNVKGSWSTSGNPADCVKLGVHELLPSLPDIVVAGINSVANLGSAIIYSGTVAAAGEGALIGIPSMAVSIVPKGNEIHYQWAADFMASFIRYVPLSKVPPHTLLNINIPDLPLSEIKGIAVTEVGKLLYAEKFEKRIDPRGRTYYWLSGIPNETSESTSTDVWAANQDQISITPLCFNMTDHVSLPTVTALKETIKDLLPASKQQASKLHG
jgi:5'-nucleotidase